MDVYPRQPEEGVLALVLSGVKNDNDNPLRLLCSLSLSPAPRSGSLEAWILSLSLSQELHLRDPRESITHTKNKNQPNPTYADLLPCRSSYKDNFNFKAASSKEESVTPVLVPEPCPWPSRQPHDH